MPQRQQKIGWLLGVALLLPAAASADVFKCVGDEGQMTFSQTPCAPKVSAAPAPTREAEPGTEVTTADDGAATGQPAPAKRELSPAVAEARSRAAQAHEEQKRRQCQTNLRAQIDNIDAQMGNDFSTPRAKALRKKQRSLRARLDDC